MNLTLWLITLYLLFAGHLMHKTIDVGNWKEAPKNLRTVAFWFQMALALIWPITMVLYVIVKLRSRS